MNYFSISKVLESYKNFEEKSNEVKEQNKIQNTNEIIPEWNEWKTFENTLLNSGFITNIVKGNNGRETNYYISENCDYVFAVYKTKDDYKHLVVDKDFYFEFLTDKNIFFIDNHLRPAINVDGKIKKLHQLIIGKPDDGLEIDHITMSSSICSKRFLRYCTRRQNLSNKPIHCKVLEDNRFMGRFQIKDKKLVRKLTKDGYKFFRVEYENAIDDNEDIYDVISPFFENEIIMYVAIKKIEKLLLGQYRYDYVFDCRHEVSLLAMFYCLSGLYHEDNMIIWQQEVMWHIKPIEFAEYYILYDASEYERLVA